ncbi:hypothetical protein ACP4OV_022319 [Aristida adscensionis]
MSASSFSGGDLVTAMVPAGGANETAGGPPVRSGVDRDAAAGRGGMSPDACWNLGGASASRKRRTAALMRTETDDSMGNEEDLDLVCEDSGRISQEIENLKSQLVVKQKELRYSHHIEKLKNENTELRAKIEDLIKNNDSHIEDNKKLLVKFGRLKKTVAQLRDENKKLREESDKKACRIINHQTSSAALVPTCQEIDIITSSEPHSTSKEQDTRSKSVDESSSKTLAEKKDDDERMMALHLLDPYYEEKHRAHTIQGGKELQVLRIRPHDTNSLMP